MASQYQGEKIHDYSNCISSALSTEMQTHTSGNITGHTFVDFFALPSKCKLSLTYKGDMDVEAFLSLRKL